MDKPVVRAAVIQAAPVLFDTVATLSKLEDLVREAADQKADIAVFPEAFVGGYPKGLDFGARLGTRSAEGRDAFRRYFQSAIAVPGPECARIGEIARNFGIHLVVGIIERDGATLYCTALMYGPDGRLLGKHRKLVPTALERIVWGQGDGSTLAVVDSDIGKIGSVICWENYMPLLRMAMYAQGIEIYCAPTVDDRDTWLPTMRTIALEGRCFVVSASQYLTREDCPPEYSELLQSEPPAVLIRGGSCIVDPLGNVLLAPEFGASSVRVAELDRRKITRGKYDLDIVGHYARPAVLTLNVNTSAQASVTFSPIPAI
ncbi:carbon-nitrogen hydrolase family protein [Hyphomicrobium sp.]|jgi:nitrilase|uniref:carbon-nitrogen hydrolase family protein n=1 Tax=Hyphomicrobium sp. TaxID=82 RepID=UPI003568163D